MHCTLALQEVGGATHLGLQVSGIGLGSPAGCRSRTVLLHLPLQILDGCGHVGLVLPESLQLLLLLAYHLCQSLHLLAHGLHSSTHIIIGIGHVWCLDHMQLGLCAGASKKQNTKKLLYAFE